MRFFINLSSTIFFSIFLCLPVQAWHIVGGEITYRHLFGDTYEISLVIFRDCSPGNTGGQTPAQFDNPAHIGIYTAGGILSQHLTIPLSTQDDTLNLTLSDPCLVIPPNGCIHTTSYVTQVNLPSIQGGYTLTYQRCCRNQEIVNITNPNQTGATFTTQISQAALNSNNSSLTFNSWPPAYLCNGIPFSFDHSATDIDGDSIAYELCTPLRGGSLSNVQPTPPLPPPYSGVSWAPGFSDNNMLGGSDPLTINPTTGLLEGTPSALGTYVVGVCAKEYRNGQLISTTRRDFQYLIGTCQQISSAAFFAPIQECNTSPVVLFTNQSISEYNSYHWDFGVPGVSDDTSAFFAPSFVYPDTGYYTVTLIVDGGTLCGDTTEVEIYVNLNGIDISTNNGQACRGDSIWLHATSITSLNTDSINYTWTPPDDIISGQGTDSILVLANSPMNYQLHVMNEFGCEDSTISQTNVTMSDAIFDYIVECNTDLTANFNNQSFTEFNSFDWDFGDLSTGTDVSTLQSPNYVYPDTGFYNVTLIVDAGSACEDTMVQQIEIRLRGIDITANDNEACLNDTSGFFVASILVENEDSVSYNWSPPTNIISGQNTDNISVLAAGDITYNVSAINQYGCADSVDVFLDVLMTAAAFDHDINCNTDLTANFSNTSFSENGSYIWDFGDPTTSSDVSTAQIPNYVYPDTGFYTVMLVVDAGTLCEDTTYRQIEVRLRGIDIDVNDQQVVCKFDTVPIFVTSMIVEDSNSVLYDWTPLSGIIDGQGTDSINVYTTTDQDYLLVATNNYGCADSAIASVNTSILTPILDITANPDSIFIGQWSQLIATDDFSYIYSWATDSTLSDYTIFDPIARPRQTTTYHLTVTNSQGCPEVDSVTVYIKPPICANPIIFIPNTFTPNGDGLNDILYVRGVNINELYFVVYNRWGQRMFETSSLTDGWDGTFQGKELGPDVYGYYLKCRCDDGDSYFQKGNITLMR